MSEPITQDDVQSWLYIVELMRGNAVQNQDDRLVVEAVANISSGAGLVNTNIPTDIVTLIVNAIEVGYASALNDVRDRDLENHGLGPIDI
jgi:predicted transcriptional regulator